MAEEVVVLVDALDNEVGTAPKLQAHLEGRLHRAISVFLFNSKGEVLLQRRAAEKYHSAGLWSNSCCSHPRPGENPHRAARRRLREEMGIEHRLFQLFSFIYRAVLDSDLIEHELDHVFVGFSDQIPEPDAAEVSEWRWAAVEEVLIEMRTNPTAYSAWFPLAFDQIVLRIGSEEWERLRTAEQS